MAENITKNLAYNIFPERDENSNKSTFGRVLNIAGSINYRGAAYLSSLPALKVGAGYVTLATIEQVINFVSAMLPEVTFLQLNSYNGAISDDNKILDIEKYDVVSIGCGLSLNEKIKEFVLDILSNKSITQNFVIDADAINILSDYKKEISLKGSVITPHPKELARLLGVSLDEVIENREKYARIASSTYDCITVLKGHNTVVTDGDRIFYNTTGSSALAKAGTGDVLTGIIAGFLAQKLSLIDAAILGVFLHGLSGDIASDDLTEYSVLASDVIDYLPVAINEILSVE